MAASASRRTPVWSVRIWMGSGLAGAPNFDGPQPAGMCPCRLQITLRAHRNRPSATDSSGEIYYIVGAGSLARKNRVRQRVACMEGLSSEIPFVLATEGLRASKRERRELPRFERPSSVLRRGTNGQRKEKGNKMRVTVLICFLNETLPESGSLPRLACAPMDSDARAP